MQSAEFMALTAHPEAFRGKLSQMSADELVATYGNLRRVMEALMDALNQPRCQNGDWDRNVAGGVFHAMLDHVSIWADDVVAELQTRKSPADDYERALTLLQHEINCGAGLPEIAALSASLAVERKH